VSDQTKPWIALHSNGLSAEINPLGAQLSILRDRLGRDLLWSGDPAFWNGRAPLLFPIVGTLAQGSYRVGRETYHLPRHGFARGRTFDLIQSTEDTATFRLLSDAETRKIYPFLFQLDVRFEIKDTTLLVTTIVQNTSDTELVASMGYHPAFRWPLPFGYARADHRIEFSHDEPAPFRQLNASGLLTEERHTTRIIDRVLRLDDDLFKNDVVIFDALRSRSVSYGALEGPRVEVAFTDSTYLGLWGKPGANFVCIEPWQGVADPDGFDDDFKKKPGVFVVQAGDTRSLHMTITLQGV
jgi:galactose mutarotase-like enzyme